MKNTLEERLQELQVEFDSGQRVAAELEAKQVSIRNTLLRISGAIQVLQELLNEGGAKEHEPSRRVNGVAAAVTEP